MKVLRDRFFPNQGEIWHKLMEQLGAETGGRLVQSLFGPGACDKVEIRHGEWTVTFDLSGEETALDVVGLVLSPRSAVHQQPQTYTRIRAPYINSDGFRFTIYAKTVYSGVAKLFGMQDIEIGERQFDDEFIIKGNNVEKVRKLFSNPKIRGLLHKMPAVTLSVRDDDGYFSIPEFPPDTDELRLTSPGFPKTTEPLKQIYDLFAETLDGLCQIGSAYQKSPAIRL